MTDNQGREAREALLAILSTAASFGIDIDLLCRLAAEELLSEDVREDAKPYVAGAVFEIAMCMDCVTGPV